MAALTRGCSDALREAAVSESRFASVAVAVPAEGPLHDPLATFARLADVDGMYWEQASVGLAFAALGCAADLAPGGGGDRFSEVQGPVAVGGVWGRWRRRRRVSMRRRCSVWGAFAFDAEREADEVWSALPRDTWVVPQVVQIQRSGQRWVQCQVVAGAPEAVDVSLAPVLALAERVLEDVAQSGDAERSTGGVHVDFHDDQSEAWWSDAVEAALGRSSEGN